VIKFGKQCKRFPPYLNSISHRVKHKIHVLGKCRWDATRPNPRIDGPMSNCSFITCNVNTVHDCWT